MNHRSMEGTLCSAGLSQDKWHIKFSGSMCVGIWAHLHPTALVRKGLRWWWLCGYLDGLGINTQALATGTRVSYNQAANEGMKSHSKPASLKRPDWHRQRQHVKQQQLAEEERPQHLRVALDTSKWYWSRDARILPRKNLLSAEKFKKLSPTYPICKSKSTYYETVCVLKSKHLLSIFLDEKKKRKKWTFSHLVDALI